MFIANGEYLNTVQINHRILVITFFEGKHKSRNGELKFVEKMVYQFVFLVLLYIFKSKKFVSVPEKRSLTLLS